MEPAAALCSVHNQLVESYCPACKHFSCRECLSSHAAHCSANPVGICTYATSHLLPECGKILETLRANRAEIELFGAKFASAVPALHKTLIALRQAIAEILQDLAHALACLDEFRLETATISPYTMITAAVEQLARRAESAADTRRIVREIEELERIEGNVVTKVLRGEITFAEELDVGVKGLLDSKLLENAWRAAEDHC